ncbi:MAG: kelch repeat-containing protein [Candidatus Acidiferrales bacterium]
MKRSLLLAVSAGVLCLLSACGGGSSPMKVLPLMITSAAPPGGTIQTTYDAAANGFSFTASGGVPPYAWSWAAAAGSALPPGLSLTGAGLISGTPTSVGNFNVQVTAKDSASPPSQQTVNYTIDISGPSFGINSSAPPSGMTGIAYDGRVGSVCKPGTPNCFCIFMPVRPSCHIGEHGFQLTVTGGTQPYTWSWSAAPGSALPPGLTLSATGLLDGVPSQAGTFAVVVAVSDSSMPALQNSADYSITVAPPPPPQISTVNSPSAVVNVAYSFTFAAAGGELPLMWSETGALPPGLSFDASGVLFGKPTATGGFPITVMVQDSAGQNATPQNFTVQVTSHGFAMTGSMNSERISHTATLLNDGTVLIVGGQDTTGTPVANAELYAPASGIFAVSGALGTARYFHSAALLSTGNVLIAGGDDISGNAIASAELYDPASKAFTALGNMANARDSFTATVLSNGKVLLAGGGNTSGVQAAAELFDPSTGTFSATGSMNTARAAHTATLLSSGKVLVTGGIDSNGDVLNTAELYDPVGGMFTLVTSNMTDERYTHTATLLGNGQVLLTGGTDGANSSVASAELYNPTTGVFAATGSMSTPRSSHRAIVLNDGTVLVEGGTDENGVPLVAAELYDPSTGMFALTGSLQSPRFRHTATLLNSGVVLVTGGANASGTLSTDELYQ